jgi:hypothetical protein
MRVLPVSLVVLAVLRTPSLRAAEAEPNWQYWEFTTHITVDIIGRGLTGADVSGTWLVNANAIPWEQEFTYRGLHWHTYTYQLEWLLLSAGDNIWTYEGPGRYIVALPDDTYCTQVGPVHCATWDIWPNGFPDGVEIHAERRPDGALIPPSLGAIVSLYAGQGCLIYGVVTESSIDSGDAGSADIALKVPSALVPPRWRPWPIGDGQFIESIRKPHAGGSENTSAHETEGSTRR